MIPYHTLRDFLFRFDPEISHALALRCLNLLARFMPQAGLISLINPSFLHQPVSVMGLDFPNPVGLAAGLDKNGDYIRGLATLGFGFLEIGTVTPLPQPGNSKPRLFRLPEVFALINRLGFNNKGVDYLIDRVKKPYYKGVLGINIGKNAQTSIEKAAEDYLSCLKQVYPFADYVTINLSSPNTASLRTLQHGTQRDELLKALKQEQALLAKEHDKYVPLVVKISPDLDDTELREIADSLLFHKIDGVIATNTTLSREGVKDLPYSNEQGGLSGKPLFEPSTARVAALHQLLKGQIPIIAVGGIMSGEDARAKLRAGASLVQIYTGLIYRGPGLVHEIIRILSIPNRGN